MATLEFKGKRNVYAHHLTVPFRPLIPDPVKSLGPWDGEGNLIIQGDNLHALKALLPRYAGRINCVYIDPPYNTGNKGWVYNDNVNSPLLQAWLTAQHGIDSKDMERHDKWLCMMWPRLNLLRELLSDDGVIFVSIDAIEHHHLRMLMDEVFGENNLIADIAVCLEPGRQQRPVRLRRSSRILPRLRQSAQLGEAWPLPGVRGGPGRMAA